MDTTLLIGLAIVVAGGGVGAIMMFGQRANPLAENASSPGTIPAGPERSSAKLTGASATDAGGRPAGPRNDGDVRIRWYQRLRSGLVLILITVGIGTAIGAVIGAAALAVSVILG